FAPLADRGKARIARHVGHADFRPDTLREVLPDGFLHDDVEPIVGAMRLAVNGVAELAAAGVVAGPRHFAHALIGGHRVFAQRAALQALVITELDTAKVHDAVHHRHFDVLAFAGARGLMKRAKQADREVQARAGIADLRAGYERR